MTDFTLHDGTILDFGQRWTFVMYTGNFVCTIESLFPKTEKVLIRWDLDVIASMTTGEDILGDKTWDLMWSSFETGYRMGLIFPYDVGVPPKKVIPFSFT